ncbi:sel1 repeat family protein [Pigmentiphaga aceris]|uniref:Sel1 repeat family protein n=1 Tax=Pigmentiphaga aceris TaxID=1940612 RepID=A0A5C0AWS6_9BURK|nr:tetratricopeptide repeat protein [Pigmentiphaga aceris]QEI06922.1 sel1 repeat family protein [Pigmentiphaga aceris]
MKFARSLTLAALMAASVNGLMAAPANIQAPTIVTRPTWLSPVFWYDVDPSTWTRSDADRIQRDADAGNAESQYFAGVLREDGKLVPQDLPGSLRYYQLAAQQGNASAQASVARMLLNGWASPKNSAEAITWNAKAAAQDNRRAIHNQGFFASRDMISPSGEATALAFYERAAGLGLPQSALEMARHYRKQGNDNPQAWRWLGTAVNTGFAPALLEFDEWCNQNPEGPDCMAKVGNALKQAAEAGYPPAQLQYGVRLWDSHNAKAEWHASLRNHFIDVALDTPGLSTDKPEGSKWMTRAAQAGNPRALFNVGLLLEEQNYRAQYYKPEYKVASIETIRTCYHHAAAAGIPDAMVALVMNLQQEQENDPLSKEERDALSAYWTGKAGETGVFQRNQMWAISFSGWQKQVGTPAPAFLRKGLGEPAQCALEALPGARKNNS